MSGVRHVGRALRTLWRALTGEGAFVVALVALVAAVAVVTMCGCVPACGGYEAAALDADAVARAGYAAGAWDAGAPASPAASDVTLTVTLGGTR